MTKLRAGLLITAGVLLLAAGAAGTLFYVKVYRPIGSPLMAMFGAKRLEDQRLSNRAPFQPPASGELTSEQVTNFVAVEEAVEKLVAGAMATFAQKQSDLERAAETEALSVKNALPVFGEIKVPYLNAKTAEIEAMNTAHFSKEEFEWVRKELYRAAGLRLSQLDLSEVLTGAPNPVIEIHQFKPGGIVPEANARLAQPLAPKLQAWLPLGFFGL